MVTTIEKPQPEWTSTKPERFSVVAPQTGDVLFYADYKEPLIPLENGVGFEGVLAGNAEGDKVQCAFCGAWKGALPLHIKEHGFNAETYKAEFGLANNTALISETTREKMVLENTKPERRKWQQKWLKQYSAAGLEKARKAMKDPSVRERSARRFKQSIRGAEARNRNGTCIAQVVAWMKANPTVSKEFAPGHISMATKNYYGGWNRVRALAGLDILHKWNQFDRELAIQSIHDFKAKYGRNPSGSDVRRGLLLYGIATYHNNFGSWSNAMRLAGLEPLASGKPVQFVLPHAEIEDRYLAGETIAGLAASYGVSSKVIQRHLRESKVPRRPRNYRKPAEVVAATAQAV